MYFSCNIVVYVSSIVFDIINGTRTTSIEKVKYLFLGLPIVYLLCLKEWKNERKIKARKTKAAKKLY